MYREAHPEAVCTVIGQGLGVPAEQVEGVGHIQPALVDAEGLAQVRIFAVYLAHHVGVFDISVKMRLHDLKLGA